LEAGDDPGLPPQALRGLVVGQRRGEDLERDLASELAVVRRVHDAHAAAIQLAAQLVAGPGEVRPLEDFAQVLDRAVGEIPHGGSVPRRARASARNSASVAVISRRVASTAVLNSRRAQWRWFVTWVTGRPSSRARSA